MEWTGVSSGALGTSETCVEAKTTVTVRAADQRGQVLDMSDDHLRQDSYVTSQKDCIRGDNPNQDGPFWGSRRCSILVRPAVIE